MKSNAKPYSPPRGAFSAAAKAMGKTRQEVWAGYNAGQERYMVAVAEAAIDMEKKAAEGRRKYREMIKRAAELAKEVNLKTAADAAQN